MFQIDIMSRKAVYEQLVEQIERYILMGILKPDEQIPSVRSMSTQLSVNPNTIQKAYSELDRRGVVYSVSGRGCFVSPAAKEKIGRRKREQLVELQARIRELALAGIGRAEIQACVDAVYVGEDRRAEGEQEERQPNESCREGGMSHDSGDGSYQEI